jgi:hypothetical protein
MIIRAAVDIYQQQHEKMLRVAVVGKIILIKQA